MTPPRYRAWRFVHPSFDAPAEFAGLQISQRGGVEMIDDEASVRQAILMLLSTRPGERVMRPDYGCDLDQLAFSPNDATTAGLAIHYVRKALDRWEPRIEVIRLDADADPDYRERLNIELTYKLRASQRRGELAFSINLLGEAL
jgi:phage baseplate assembly protein W